MANSVDPDQMLHSAASDLGLHCLQMPLCPNTYGYYCTKCPKYLYTKVTYKMAYTNSADPDDY